MFEIDAFASFFCANLVEFFCEQRPNDAERLLLMILHKKFWLEFNFSQKLCSVKGRVCQFQNIRNTVQSSANLLKSQGACPLFFGHHPHSK